MILDAIATHPEKAKAVTMVATDAVYFRKPHPTLPHSEKLGEWDSVVRENLTQFKPGVYWDDSTREMLASDPKATPKIKSRGVNAKALAREIAGIDATFASWVPGPLAINAYPSISITVEFSVITLQQALQGKEGMSWSKAGKVIENRKLKQDSNPSSKRHPALQYDKARKMFRSEPYAEPDDLESKPYPKHFGYDMSDEMDTVAGMTPDGPGLMQIREALGVG
jgi:hypothetical protein